MQATLKVLRWIVFGFIIASCVWAQDQEQRKSTPGPARQIGSGAGNIGIGAARGAGDLAKGSAKAAGNLVTLYPIDAGVSLGKGAGTATKDVAVGTVKGTGKIATGVGRAFKRIF